MLSNMKLEKGLPSNYILERGILMFKRCEEIFNLSSEMRNLLHYEIAKRFAKVA